MNFWINIINLFFLLVLMIIIFNNKNIFIFIIWAEIVWIFLFLLSILYSTIGNSLVLIKLFFILIFTAMEVSLTSIIFIKIFK